MKIVVCVKWVGSLGDDVEFVDDEHAVDPDYLDHSLNEWDAYATEEALRLRETMGGNVIAVTVGTADAEGALVHCLAMGVDRAIRVPVEDAGYHDPIAVAGMLASVIGPERPDLVLCGAQTSDAAQGATGSALAALLDLPCATLVTTINPEGSMAAVVRRELEGGRIDVAAVSFPALLTIQTGSRKPRYVTLRALQQARQLGIALADASPSNGARGYVVRRMYAPPAGGAEMIAGNARAIAERIGDLIKEARA